MKKIFKPNIPFRIKNLTWPQAKVRFPALNPYGDVDNDGVKNYMDCRPFDIKRQGRWHKNESALDDVEIGFETIKQMKTVGDVQKLEESILNKGEDK